MSSAHKYGVFAGHFQTKARGGDLGFVKKESVLSHQCLNSLGFIGFIGL